MENWETNRQSFAQACKKLAGETAREGPAPPALLKAKSDRMRSLWLMNEEKRRESELGQRVRYWLVHDSWPKLTLEEKFFLHGRMCCAVEFIDELVSVGFSAELNRAFENGTAFAHILLVESWPRRRESWWFRFLGRVISGQVWEDPAKPSAKVQTGTNCD